jgi:hypothetical protein
MITCMVSGFQAAQEAEQLRRQLKAVAKQLAREEQAASRQLQALANKGQRAANEARDAVADVERSAEDKRLTQISVGLVTTMACSGSMLCGTPLYPPYSILESSSECAMHNQMRIYALHNPAT